MSQIKRQGMSSEKKRRPDECAFDEANAAQAAELKNMNEVFVCGRCGHTSEARGDHCGEPMTPNDPGQQVRLAEPSDGE